MSKQAVKQLFRKLEMNLKKENRSKMNKKKQITSKSEIRSQRLKRYQKDASDNSLVRLPYTNCFVKEKDYKKALELKAAYHKLIFRVSE